MVNGKQLMVNQKDRPDDQRGGLLKNADVFGKQPTAK
jgi:hypothetical protein